MAGAAASSRTSARPCTLWRDRVEKQRVKQRVIVMRKRYSKENLADLSSENDFLRLRAMNCLFNAESGRALPEKKVQAMVGGINTDTFTRLVAEVVACVLSAERTRRSE